MSGSPFKLPSNDPSFDEDESLQRSTSDDASSDWRSLDRSLPWSSEEEEEEEDDEDYYYNEPPPKRV